MEVWRRVAVAATVAVAVVGQALRQGATGPRRQQVHAVLRHASTRNLPWGATCAGWAASACRARAAAAPSTVTHHLHGHAGATVHPSLLRLHPPQPPTPASTRRGRHMPHLPRRQRAVPHAQRGDVPCEVALRVAVGAAAQRDGAGQLQRRAAGDLGHRVGRGSGGAGGTRKVWMCGAPTSPCAYRRACGRR